MINYLKILFFSFFICFFMNSTASAQQTDDVGGDVLLLEEIKVEVKIEEPRVAIIKSRKKPEFDHIELEKSFKPELLAILKSVSYTSVSSGKVEVIPDIKALANKSREIN